jgi:hypothetical protein
MHGRLFRSKVCYTVRQALSIFLLMFQTGACPEQTGEHKTLFSLISITGSPFYPLICYIVGYRVTETFLRDLHDGRPCNLGLPVFQRLAFMHAKIIKLDMVKRGST